MNVTIWNSQSKVEKLYVNPTIEFEFLSRHQILSLKLNNDRYPIAHYKETFFLIRALHDNSLISNCLLLLQMLLSED